MTPAEAVAAFCFETGGEDHLLALFEAVRRQAREEALGDADRLVGLAVTRLETAALACEEFGDNGHEELWADTHRRQVIDLNALSKVIRALKDRP